MANAAFSLKTQPAVFAPQSSVARLLAPKTKTSTAGGVLVLIYVIARLLVVVASQLKFMGTPFIFTSFFWFFLAF